MKDQAEKPRSRLGQKPEMGLTVCLSVYIWLWESVEKSTFLSLNGWSRLDCFWIGFTGRARMNVPVYMVGWYRSFFASSQVSLLYCYVLVTQSVVSYPVPSRLLSFLSTLGVNASGGFYLVIAWFMNIHIYTYLPTFIVR